MGVITLSCPDCGKVIVQDNFSNSTLAGEAFHVALEQHKPSCIPLNKQVPNNVVPNS